MYISWLIHEEAEFDIAVTEGSLFGDLKFQLPAKCSEQKNANEWYCFVYFVRLDDGDLVSIQEKGKNTATAIPISFEESL